MEQNNKKKRGRKRVKGEKSWTPYRDSMTALEFFEDYVMGENLGEMFRLGEFSASVEMGTVSLKYVLPNSKNNYELHLPVVVESRRDFDELFQTLQNFVLDMYHYYEYDGQAVSLTRLGVLMGVSKQAVHKEIGTIFQKVHERKKAYSYLDNCREK